MNWSSTKFIQTSFVLIAAVALKWADSIDNYTFGLVIGFALGNYAHHDVKQKGVT
jgi:hypothetical protein